MNDQDASIHRTLVRSRETFTQWVNDFAEGGAGRRLYAGLQADITEIERLAAAFGTGRSQAKQGTQTLGDAREAVLAGLFAIREASKPIGVEDKFPYPPRNNDEQLLQMIDVYATNALPLKPELIAHELPATFLEDLADDKAAFQAAMTDRSNSVGDHISARQELDEALARGVQRLRDLTSVVKVKYADDPGKLAEWMAASHIERPSRRAKAGGGPPSTPPPATP